MQKHKLLECVKILRKTSTIAEWEVLNNLAKILENIARNI